MASTASTTQTTLSRFYRTLLEQAADSTQLATEASRIDNGATSLATTLKQIYDSPSRSTGRTNELAEAFFVLFDRAPDPSTFNACMDLLRNGKSLADIIALGLGAPGYQLSNSGITSNTAYVNKLYDILTGGLSLTTDAAAALAALIDSGQLSRAQLMAYALESPQAIFHADRSAMVQMALIYMAAANQEASAAQLAYATGDVAQDIVAALNSGGLGASSSVPFFVKPGASSTELDIKGTTTTDLVINLQNNVVTLGGASGFKAQYSINDGFDASSVTFNSSYVKGVTSIDASQLTGKGLLSFTGSTSGGNYTVLAPAAGSLVIQGGDGNDLLVGGAGVDKLVATAGNDTLTGGGGADVFVLGKFAAYTGGAFTQITDLGNGTDTLDFSQLLGTAAPKSSSLKAVSVDTTTRTTLANGSVTLLDDNGRWGSRMPTAAEITDLFGGAGATPSKPFTAPTTSGRYILITADLVNDANIWLINNATDVTSITASEVLLIGQIDGDWNAMLNGFVPILR